jgi:hypothetical protein
MDQVEEKHMVPNVRGVDRIAITSGCDLTLPTPQRILDRIKERTAFSALRVPRTRKPCDLWLGNLSGGCRPQIGWCEDGFDIVATVGGILYREERLDGAPLPDGMLVCHACDVYTCVNPEHLYLGTHHMNGKDVSRRGSAQQQGVAKLEVYAQLMLRSQRGIKLPTALVKRARALGLYSTPPPIPTTPFPLQDRAIVNYDRARWQELA